MTNFTIKDFNFGFNFIGKIICSTFGHKMIITKNVTNHFREFKCSTCGLELTNDIHGHKIALTPKLKDINESLNILYTRRHLSV